MAEIVVCGGNRLSGSIEIQGAKNAALPILAATVLINGRSVIHNCPKLSDVEVSIRILKHLGCGVCRSGNTVVVDSRSIYNCEIPENLMSEMRSSIVFLGAVAGRMGKAVLSSPGGCELGPRPIDLHICALKKMGLIVCEEHGKLDCHTNGLKGKDINLSFPSVGATENIILAATTAKGTTRIFNAAREPEICDLADFLRKSGAKISGDGSGCITIEGVESLGSVEHSVMPDRIIAATYMSAAAVTGGDVLICGIGTEPLVQISDQFAEMGCEIVRQKNGIRIKAPQKLRRIPLLRTLPYPGFPTDAGPPLMSAMAIADGCSVLVENIFSNRFRYTDELKRLGADIKVEGRVAIVEGGAKLTGAHVRSTDLRGGAALVIAALAAEGTTSISDIKYIDRGHEKIEETLRSIGADIKRE